MVGEGRVSPLHIKGFQVVDNLMGREGERTL
jgi:hypothetical protein